jgi:hypothetical protein
MVQRLSRISRRVSGPRGLRFEGRPRRPAVAIEFWLLSQGRLSQSRAAPSIGTEAIVPANPPARVTTNEVAARIRRMQRMRSTRRTEPESSVRGSRRRERVRTRVCAIGPRVAQPRGRLAIGPVVRRRSPMHSI